MKRLRFSEFEGARQDQYFFQRFRFRNLKEHIIQFMTAIELFDEENREFKRIKLDCYRHLVMADTVMLIFLARLSTAGTYLSMMDEFGMDEKQVSTLTEQVFQFDLKLFFIISMHSDCRKSRFGRNTLRLLSRK